MPWTSDNVTEVTILGLWTNLHPIVSVLHVRREEDNPVQSARDVLNNWQDHITGPCMMNNYSLQGARYRDRNEVDGVTGFIAPDPAKPVVGAGSAASCSPNVSRLVKKGIETHANQRSGRIYLGPWDDAGIDEDGRITASVVTAQNALLATFLDGVSGPSDNELVVVHGTGVDSGSKSVSIVTSLLMDPIVATQRRRLR